MTYYTKRGYVAGNFGIELDGLNAGWLQSFEGGMAVTDVVTEKLGPDHLSHRHIAGLKYEDITCTFGTGMSKSFFKWLGDSFTSRDYTRRNGAIVSANYNFKETSRLTFTNALIN